MKARSIFAALFLSAAAQAQTSFHKGSLLISLSEGATFTRFRTYSPPFSAGLSGAMIAPTTNGDTHTPTPDVINDGNVNGDRDPLSIEYGVSNHVGISLSMGGDVLNVDPVKYYGTALPGKTKAITSETTFDINYHFLSTRRVDLSAYVSVGFASATLRNYELKRDTYQGYTYVADGSIARLGARARYYFTNRLGVVGMVSVFAMSLTSEYAENNTIAQGYDTKIKGCAIEVGPCVRLLK